MKRSDVGRLILFFLYTVAVLLQQPHIPLCVCVCLPRGVKLCLGSSTSLLHDRGIKRANKCKVSALNCTYAHTQQWSSASTPTNAQKNPREGMVDY